MHIIKINTGYFAAERAGISRVLCNFNLLDLFPQRRTITCAIFTCDSNLPCSSLTNTEIKIQRWDEMMKRDRDVPYLRMQEKGLSRRTAKTNAVRAPYVKTELQKKIGWKNKHKEGGKFN